MKRKLANLYPADRYMNEVVNYAVGVERRRQKKLQGVQLPLLPGGRALAYRAVTANGSLVLCDRHLGELRAQEAARLTGESFPARLCDRCLSESNCEEEL